LVSSVLSFPLLIPTLIVSLKAARKSMMGIENLSFIQDWLVLLLIFAITVILSIVLFRHIWTD
jgi:heme exporter protein B